MLQKKCQSLLLGTVLYHIIRSFSPKTSVLERDWSHRNCWPAQFPSYVSPWINIVPICIPTGCICFDYLLPRAGWPSTTYIALLLKKTRRIHRKTAVTKYLSPYVRYVHVWSVNQIFLVPGILLLCIPWFWLLLLSHSHTALSASCGISSWRLEDNYKLLKSYLSRSIALLVSLIAPEINNYTFITNVSLHYMCTYI